MASSMDRNDPYAYTGGKWLYRDKIEQSLRYIQFDFEALRRRVLEISHDSKSIVSYEKKEGGFNRVFIFVTDTGKKIIAKIPFSLAGPRFLVTKSEVATNHYLRSQTSIPIPKILDWSDNAQNPIGSEYIIMEHAGGVSLHEIWPSLDLDSQVKCIKSICEHLKTAVDLDFPAYGSIYFASMNTTTSAYPRLGDEYCIGPHCGAIYWNCNATQPRFYHYVKPNQGPWTTLAAYCDGLIDTGLSRIPPVSENPRRPRLQGSVEAHRELLDYGREIIKTMAADPRIKKVAKPTLYHPDLHKRNIFVSKEDPTAITAIIDWQSASIEPAFWYADEVPDFAKALPDPSNEDRLEPKSETCAKVYDVSTQYYLPKLAEPRLMDDDFFRPFRYCFRTWSDGAVAFREELIQTSRRWKELGFSGECPFPLPNDQELIEHTKNYNLFKASQELKHTLAGALNCATDGWVSPEDWERVKELHPQMYNLLLQEILENKNPDEDDPLKSEADVREIWPFDLPT